MELAGSWPPAHLLPAHAHTPMYLRLQVVAESSALDGCWVCVLNYEGFDALQCRVGGFGARGGLGWRGCWAFIPDNTG